MGGSLRAGGNFGDYRVVRRLGKGGMGEVWLLQSASGGLVAAKILNSADHEARRRFLREAEYALGVKHPNLVETYDVGEDPDTGLCYILMEYVPGGTLANRLREVGAMPVGDAVAVVKAMASVLELGRQKGIVHRDIKPANIMFASDGTPKLSDLGIARGGIGGGADTTTVTQTGMMIGTPAYMSPEQMLDAHNVDTRADIYSLGVVFFEMLTGERPHRDDTVMQLMARAVKGEPLPDVRTRRPDVPVPLAKLLGMMVAPDKDRRISTPGQITDALAVIESGGSIGRSRKMTWPLETFGRIGRLPRNILLPAGLLVLLVIVIAVLPGRKDNGQKSAEEEESRVVFDEALALTNVVEEIEKEADKDEAKTEPTVVAVVVDDTPPPSDPPSSTNNVASTPPTPRREVTEPTPPPVVQKPPTPAPMPATNEVRTVKTNAVNRAKAETRKDNGRKRAKAIVKKQPSPPGKPVSYFQGWSVVLGKAYSEDAVPGRRGQVLTQTHVLFARTMKIPRADGFPKPKLKLCLTVAGEPGEKSYVFAKVSGALVGDRVISSSSWATHEFDVSRWAGQEVFVEIDCAPSERKWSRVHWQQIKVR